MALDKSHTSDFRNMAVQCQEIQDNAGNVVTSFSTSSSAPGNVTLDVANSSVDHAGKTVRVSFNTDTGTANHLIGMQIKPPQGANNANGVTGLEVSPRVNNTFTSGTIIGIHADAFLKGTTGDLSGDVRALNLELVTDDAGTRTIAGNVNAIRIRSAFSGTISGKFVPIRIEKAETQTNSKQYDAVLDLPSTLSGVWHDTQTSATGAGFIKVLVNGNARYITLTSGAPS